MAKKRARKINFDTSIYKPAAIREAVKAFQAHAQFRVRFAERSAAVMIVDDSDTATRLADEFCNYVLGVNKRCYRAQESIQKR
jgi:hypothetical protein